MRDYLVSYYFSLRGFYHAYTIEAENEAQAIQKALVRIPETSKVILHDFKIKRDKIEWN